MARRAGRPVRLVLTLEETFQAVRRAASEVRVRSGFHADGTLAFRDIEANYLVGAYADIADRVVAKGSYTSNGPYRTPAVRIRARSLLSNTVPSTAFRGFGNPQQIWAVESNMDEAAVRLGHRPARLAAAEPRPSRGRVHPRRPAGGRRMGRDRAAGGRPDRLGIAGASGPRPGHRGGPQGGPDDRPVLLNRPAARRRERRRDRGDLGHGPGGAHDLRPDRRPGAGRAGRLGHGRQRRHGERALRPADLGQPLVGADGERRAARLPRRPVEARRDGSAPGGRRGRGRDRGPGRGPDRRSSVADPRRAHPRPRAAGGEVIGVGEMRKEAAPEHPLGGTAAFYEFNCTAVEVVGRPGDRRRDGGAARDGVGRRAGAAPRPGARPGRGRGRHGARAHADGALPVR